MTMAGYKNLLHIDLETYSSVDLGKSGVYKYAESPDFRILLFGYAFNDEPVTVIDMANGEHLPISILNALTDENIIKVAHNANFERVCLTRHLKDLQVLDNWYSKDFDKKLSYEGFLPPEQWKDTMIMAVEHGYPGALASLGPALGLDDDKVKLATGKRLIQYFCCPCRPTKANGGRTINLPKHAPDKWETFIEYNKRDVESEQAIYNTLDAMGEIPDFEWNNWYMDQHINDRGIQVAVDLIQSIWNYHEELSESLAKEAKEITKLDNPQSVMQLKQWLFDTQGITINSITKEVVKDLLKEDISDDARRVLEIRQELGKTSVKKYEAFIRSACSDGRVRGCFQFFGGRTGRWAGRLIQPQNFPRNSFDDMETARNLVAQKDWPTLEALYGSMNDVFSTLIRTMIIPRPGTVFAIADYSAIEARVIAWLTRTTWRQDVFKNGGDIYCASASQMFGVPVEKHGVNGHLRQKGKIAELALGYGGGTAALEAFGASKMGLSQEQQQEIVTKWRQASPNIPNFWYELQHAFEKAINGGYTQLDRNMAVFKSHGNVYIQLPNGRRIAYVSPCIEDGQIKFMGLNQTTRQWCWINTWGGKLTENVVQAIARDCLCETMKGCDLIGVDCVMHVHDEVICEANTRIEQEAFEKLLEVMAKPIEWAPDLILVGDGFTSTYYKKD